MNARAGAATSVLILGALLGCSDNTIPGTQKSNAPPEVWLSSGPVEGDTTGYKVHFYWGGWDPDGEIARFEYTVVDGSWRTGYGFDPDDTTGIEKWKRTASYDSVFKVAADSSPRNFSSGGALYTRYEMTHTFFVRSIDLQGKRSEPAYRSFTAWNIAPYVNIEQPALPGSGVVSTLGRVIRFKWTGRDPVDDPNNLQEPDSIRYLYTQIVDTSGRYDQSFDIIRDLNKNPHRYEKRWSRWIWYRAPQDSGRSTVLGDDELLELHRSHIFALQAKDEAGAVTAIFDAKSNVRKFIVSQKGGPRLTICEPFLGCFVFLGTYMRPTTRDLPPGVKLNFSWRADAADYGGEVTCYRYGWDVADVNDPNAWEVLCSPYNLSTSKTIYSGTHVLFVEAVDNSGTSTLGQIEINVVPFTMDRNLLWVDDYFTTELDTLSTDYNYSTPSLSGYRKYWIGHCKKAIGFDQSRDVYDVHDANNRRPPGIALIGRYRNIIWSYAVAPDEMAWDDIVAFTPESQVNAGSKLTVNYLSIYLAKGGHLLTEGRSDRSGGLAAVLLASAQAFPLGLRCETATGPKEGCEGDTSGVNSMAYKDYCVSVIDKVSGPFRTGTNMPIRRESQDGLIYARLSREDPVAASLTGLPDSLGLSQSVVRPGKFFDPRVRGFLFVELYDPPYWMSKVLLTSQPCFHPLYQMRARSTASPVDNAPMALVLTKYAHVDADEQPGGTVPAPSFHFGSELWFFSPGSVNAIMSVVFDRWGIRAP